jgi:Na+/citrate or Na+/malate symporter
MKSDYMRTLLSIAIIILVGSILWMINEGKLQQTMRDIALIVVGHILAKFSGVYDFYFGSSDGSKDKTAMMTARPVELDQDA